MGLLALASSVFADVTYSVVAFPKDPANKIAVQVKDLIYPLKLGDESTVWSAKVPGVSGSNPYRYVEVDRSNKVVAREDFERRFKDSSKSATPNEFFGRKDTFSALPELKQIYKDVRPKPSKVFDNTQVATINFKVDQAAFDNMLQHPKDRLLKIKTSLVFVNADVVHYSKNVTLSISGNSSRKRQKVSLKLNFKGDDTFFDRPIIKLRSEASDMAVMREMLYVDVLNAVGVPTSQGSWVRVYANGKPHGFFLMMEDIEKPFVKTTLHHGSVSDSTKLGSLYQMGKAEAPMIYQGPSASDYNSNVYETQFASPDDQGMVKWIAFMKDLRDFKSSDRDAVTFWNKRLELESFLRAMAVDYLTGAWDSFWARGHNYFMYLHPQTNLWNFIPSDLDHSFNGGDRPAPNLPYQKWIPVEGSQGFTGRPLVTKLIYGNQDIKKMFETILRTITQDVFNSGAMDPRIEAYKTQIEKDVAWDYAIDRSHLPGDPFTRTLASFYSAIKGSVAGDKVKGVKPYINLRAKYVLANVGK
ncbi:hypothetical protein DFQ26_006744 [Actinomortierella ambigua]|nr:hypothetical protein DFQ26_006744 [Actinomortierella ambigua]